MSSNNKHKQPPSDMSEIPAEGMLGLLALGATGLIAWRERRAQVEGEDWRDTLAQQANDIKAGFEKDTEQVPSDKASS